MCRRELWNDSCGGSGSNAGSCGWLPGCGICRECCLGPTSRTTGVKGLATLRSVWTLMTVARALVSALGVFWVFGKCGSGSGSTGCARDFFGRRSGSARKEAACGWRCWDRRFGRLLNILGDRGPGSGDALTRIGVRSRQGRSGLG